MNKEMIIETNKLLVSFKRNGNTVKDLRRDIRDLTSRTEFAKIPLCEINLFTAVRYVEESGLIHGYLHKGDLMERNSSLSVKELGLTEELIEELMTGTRLLLMVEEDDGTEEWFVTDDTIWCTLSQRAAGAVRGGDSLIRLKQDSLTASVFKRSKKNVKMVYRTAGGARKAYCLFTDRYALVDQSILIDRLIGALSSGIEPVEIHKYKVSNFYTEVFFEFPLLSKTEALKKGITEDYAVAGVHLRISDLGKSIEISQTMRFGEFVHIVEGRELTKNHTGIVSIDEIISDTIHMLDMTGALDGLYSLSGKVFNSPVDKVIDMFNYCDVGNCRCVGKMKAISMKEDLIVELKENFSPKTGYELCRKMLEIPDRWRFEDAGYDPSIKKNIRRQFYHCVRFLKEVSA